MALIKIMKTYYQSRINTLLQINFYCFEDHAISLYNEIKDLPKKV